MYTASAGNFAQGLAYCTKHEGIPCDVFVPEHAPDAKVNAVEALGGVVHKVPFDVWWSILMAHEYKDMDGKFIHPVSDKSVIAGGLKLKFLAYINSFCNNSHISEDQTHIMNSKFYKPLKA